MNKHFQGNVRSLVKPGILVLLGAVLAGCWVTKDQYKEDLAAIHSQLDKNTSDIQGLQGELQRMRQEFQAQITEMKDGIRFAMPVHFDFDKADIRLADEAALNRFASIAKKYYPDATITVEGFADPAGSVAYNKRLSERRAKAAADYLVSQGGLSEASVKTVGYGKTRLVKPGARGPGEAGIENRRVVFVIEYAPSAG